MLDDALVLSKYRLDKKNVIVSILIVLDDALVQVQAKCRFQAAESLNPYCAGRCSSTVQEFIDKHKLNGVSILIVLDDPLVRVISLGISVAWCLNPYCAGRCSSTVFNLQTT